MCDEARGPARRPPLSFGPVQDEVFAQYREAGVLMWRGFSLQNFADQVMHCLFFRDAYSLSFIAPLVHARSALCEHRRCGQGQNDARTLRLRTAALVRG